MKNIHQPNRDLIHQIDKELHEMRREVSFCTRLAIKENIREFISDCFTNNCYHHGF